MVTHISGLSLLSEWLLSDAGERQCGEDPLAQPSSFLPRVVLPGLSNAKATTEPGDLAEHVLVK